MSNATLIELGLKFLQESNPSLYTMLNVNSFGTFVLTVILFIAKFRVYKVVQYARDRKQYKLDKQREEEELAETERLKRILRKVQKMKLGGLPDEVLDSAELDDEDREYIFRSKKSYSAVRKKRDKNEKLDDIDLGV